jgi:hypothetical protein
MRRIKTSRGRLVEAAVIAVCLMSSGAAGADPNEAFTKRLMEIRAGGGTGTQDAAKLEAEGLQLIPDHNTPAEKGRIYATIALVYCERGFGRCPPEETKVRLAKTIEYTNKALACPLDAPTACNMYGRLSDAINVSARGGPKDKWPEARRAAIVPCLKGLKLALGHKAPKERPDSPPAVGVPFILTPDGRLPEDERERYEKQRAARKEYDRLRELYFQRWALTQRCGALYSREPYDAPECRAFAEKILVGHEEAVNEIMQLVEAKIERDKEFNAPPARDRQHDSRGSP